MAQESRRVGCLLLLLLVVFGAFLGVLLGRCRGPRGLLLANNCLGCDDQIRDGLPGRLLDGAVRVPHREQVLERSDRARVSLDFVRSVTKLGPGCRNGRGGRRDRHPRQ